MIALSSSAQKTFPNSKRRELFEFINFILTSPQIFIVGVESKLLFLVITIKTELGSLENWTN